MNRLTREKDNYECRIKGGCRADQWMYEIYGKYPYDISDMDICDVCPFMAIINLFARREDEWEALEDDRK